MAFDVKMPDVCTLSAEQLNAELEKGYADIEAGHRRDAETVFCDLRRDYERSYS